MATREEKLQLVEDLKTQIEVMKNEIAEQNEKQMHEYKVGGRIRTAIVLLLVAAGVGVLAYFLTK